MFLCYYLFISRILLVSSSLEKEKQINYIFNQSAQNVLNSFLTKGEVVFQFCVRNCCYFLGEKEFRKKKLGKNINKSEKKKENFRRVAYLCVCFLSKFRRKRKERKF